MAYICFEGFCAILLVIGATFFFVVLAATIAKNIWLEEKLKETRKKTSLYKGEIERLNKLLKAKENIKNG